MLSSSANRDIPLEFLDSATDEVNHSTITIESKFLIRLTRR